MERKLWRVLVPFYFIRYILDSRKLPVETTLKFENANKMHENGV